MSKFTTAIGTAVLGTVVAVVLVGLVANRALEGPNQAVSTACVVPARGGPGYNASITNAQNGKTICITAGQRLPVFLSSSPPGGPRWQPPHAPTTGVLRIAPLTLMLVRGVTATNFVAVHRGIVQITSERPACAPVRKGAASCHAILLWRATIVVQAARSEAPPRRP